MRTRHKLGLELAERSYAIKGDVIHFLVNCACSDNWLLTVVQSKSCIYSTLPMIRLVG